MNGTQIALLIFLIIIICLLFWIIILSFRKRFSKNKKIHEIFEYDWDSLCPSQFKNSFDTKGKKYTNIININKLKWSSNPNPSNYFSLFYNTSSMVYREKFLKEDEKTINASNYWITVYDKLKNTVVGSIRFSTINFAPPPKVVGKSATPFKFTKVSAASGAFMNLENCNVLMDFSLDKRKIHIYNDDYKNLEYEKYKKKLNI